MKFDYDNNSGGVTGDVFNMEPRVINGGGQSYDLNADVENTVGKVDVNQVMDSVQHNEESIKTDKPNASVFWRPNSDGSIQITEHKRIIDSGLPLPIKAGLTAIASGVTNNVVKPLAEQSRNLGTWGKVFYPAIAVGSMTTAAATGFGYKIEDDRGDTSSLDAFDYSNANRGE